MISMRPNNAPRLKIGDTLDAVVIKSAGGRRFLLKCKAAPDGWTVELHSRKPEGIEPGSNAHVWIGKINPLKRLVLTYDGDMGRLPISFTMGKRYLAGLEALTSPEPMTPDQIADVRSMMTRISEQNQADWLTVWKTLGEPAIGDTKEFAAALINLKETRKTNPEEAPALQESIALKYGEMIQAALKRLDEYR